VTKVIVDLLHVLLRLLWLYTTKSSIVRFDVPI
jgi:hypothetical protein